jgi:hypothetical protein
MKMIDKDERGFIYKRVFKSPEGARVLSEILDVSGYLTGNVKPGFSDAVPFILASCGITPEEHAEYLTRCLISSMEMVSETPSADDGIEEVLRGRT